MTGIVKRLRQLDSDHHSAGPTATSIPSFAKLLEPGGKRPCLRQLRSANDGDAAGASQLIPAIGITTMEHATVSLQPSDSFSTSLRTSNCTSPLPEESVKAAISAAGNAAPTAASGGIESASHPG